MWCGGCGGRGGWVLVVGVQKVYFKCSVVLFVLFDLREHIQNLNVFFFFSVI